MTVSTICNYNVATVDSRSSIVEAAKLMRAEHVGDLVVVEEREGRVVPVGIITDRDIVVGVLAEGKRLDDATVGDAMSAKLVTVKEDNGVLFALREMRRAGVRRAPVVGPEGALVAVLSIDDAIDHLAAQLGEIAEVIRHGQQTEQKTRP